mmetsp:Transcript_53256/g.147548  ORF Transcript_53256/g.147548 Transcript_53256/m.147548 type:complete len:245 (-) Transcript_53256:441-1175(-)
MALAAPRLSASTSVHGRSPAAAEAVSLSRSTTSSFPLAHRQKRSPSGSKGRYGPSWPSSSRPVRCRTARKPWVSCILIALWGSVWAVETKPVTGCSANTKSMSPPQRILFPSSISAARCWTVRNHVGTSTAKQTTSATKLLTSICFRRGRKASRFSTGSTSSTMRLAVLGSSKYISSSRPRMKPRATAFKIRSPSVLLWTRKLTPPTNRKMSMMIRGTTTNAMAQANRLHDIDVRRMPPSWHSN